MCSVCFGSLLDFVESISSCAKRNIIHYFNSTEAYIPNWQFSTIHYNYYVTMVRTTQILLKYIPEWYHLQKSGNSFFKKQSLFHMTRFHANIAWSTHKNAMNRFHYYLKGEMFWNNKLSQHRRDINRSRIAAACEEHGYNYQNFVSTLPKLDVNLNLYSLSRLAIYEPKTFKSLVEICKSANEEALEPANFNESRL